MGLFKRFFASLFKAGCWTTFTAIAVLISSLILAPPPVTIQPHNFSIPLNIKFEGALGSNNELSLAEKLYEDQLVGPESFALFQGDLFTGTADGLILKFRYGTPLKVVAHIGDDTGCRYDKQRWRLSECGRPLGLRFDSNGKLFVLDAYRGIKRIDVKTGYVELVCDIKKGLERLEGRIIDNIFIDDFVIHEQELNNNNLNDKSSNHVFYISDASSKWPLEFVNHVVLDSGDKSGRILKCSSSGSGESIIEIVDSGLRFPNGLEMSPNNDYFLVNELNERRILKYYIKGSNKGRREVLSDNLPGFPDNIKLSSASSSLSGRSSSSSSTDEEASKKLKEDDNNNEAYWVALYEGFESNQVNPIYRILSSLPYLVQGFTSAAHNLGLFIHQVGTKFNHSTLQQVGYEIKSLIIHQKWCKSYGLILKINSKGKIIKSLHSPNGKINHLSEVYEVIENGKRVIYLGSYFNNYIGRLVIQ